MAILLTGAGGLFTRLGHLFGGGLDLLALEGGTATARVLSGASWLARENTILGDYQAGTPLPGPITGTVASLDSAIASWRGSQQGLFQLIQSIAQQTMIQMANADTPLAQQTLLAALQLLIAQMKTAAASVNQSAPAAGAQTGVGTPTGNPTIIVSLKSGNGLILENILPETLTFACATDAQAGAVPAGAESLSVAGQAATQSPYAYNWPLGSGVATTLSAVDGSKNNPVSNNLLTNSDFLTTTTANVPDNWTIQAGAAGTEIFAGSGLTPYTSAGGVLKFTGTATAPAVTQSFSTTPTATLAAGGTAAVLKADTVYHVSGWVKVSAAPAAGVLEIALTDGSAYPGTVQNDDQAVANLFTVALTTATTAYAKFTGVFRTPAVLPTTTPPFRLRIRLSTGIDAGKSCFIGRLSITPATQLYGPQGPFVSIHSGNVNMVNGLSPDSWTVAITNVMGVFQREFQRYFNMTSLGQILPSNVAPTISDSLVA